MNIKNDKFLDDIKLRDINLNLSKNTKAVERLLERYYQGEGDYENVNKENACPEIVRFVKDAYKEMNWGSYSCYDVANPLWSTLTAAMVECTPKYKYEPSKLLYLFDKKNSIKYYVYNPKKGTRGYEYLSKKILGKKACEKSNINYEAMKETVERYPKLDNYSALCDSIANFMPCPSKEYNRTKGLLPEVKDYLTLMIDYIQMEMDLITSENKDDLDVIFKNDELEIMVKDIKCWHKWFADVNNRSKCFLEDYYNISRASSGNLIISGIPLFAGQTLKYPLPKAQHEIEECIENLISRANDRAIKMSNFIIENRRNKNCNVQINDIMVHIL